MAQEPNHRCIVCGKPYRVCDDCLKKHSFLPWRTIADTREHYPVYLVLIQYRDGYLSRPEAREKLSRISFSPEECREGVRRQIQEIFSEPETISPC